MRFIVADEQPPRLLLEAAAAYSTHCCAGVLDLRRDRAGYWQATLIHELDCLDPDVAPRTGEPARDGEPVAAHRADRAARPPSRRPAARPARIGRRRGRATGPG
ncbi:MULTISPECIES: hypothetical protein [unclassified Pseudofrankia]|uniref:hypothetical protein n=1 Tax=unclassified Pseudofrankia TaxID=2994372 RepID=UPI0008DACD4E|nr:MULTISPECIES: hypothetical protein [unclassified Pseudofrankia]MDT3441957.1 hypothetical protein [Pseudofrankia sp. BMG5.37]OHV44590.1 hypothetical protein BCD48_25405 [Pseudofrankia sp. BMG5.36]